MITKQSVCQTVNRFGLGGDILTGRRVYYLRTLCGYIIN